MEFSGKKVLVFGTGRSGIGAAKLLLSLGSSVLLFDEKENLDREAVMGRFSPESKLTLVLKELSPEILSETDLAVLSPGVPLDNPSVLRIKAAGIPVTGEIELGYQAGKGQVLAVTGTNGKTTTTSLLYEIMERYVRETGSGRRVHVVGNIGNPWTEAVPLTEEDSILVAEISSFQLETIQEFRPVVSAILNITPDHLDRHHSMENYIAAKEAVAANQRETDTIVLNYDDPLTREFGERVKVHVVYFTRNEDLPEELLKSRDFVYLKGNQIYWRGEAAADLDKISLLGGHNYENVMAAIGMAVSFGVPLPIIREAVYAFQGVPHRIEFVRTVGDVDFYNDSKGTNPDAAVKAVQAMRKPTVLIGGGYDKKLPYDDWIESFGDRVKHLVLIGETAEDIEACAKRHEFTAVTRAAGLKEAVEEAFRLASPGDAVLLSPACASWDMFPNYEVRGDKFKEYVKEL